MSSVATSEQTVVRLRAHAASLLPAAGALLAVSAAAGLALGWVRDRPGWVSWVVGAAAAVVALRMCVAPYLRWWTTTYELTTRRLALRWGVLSRHGRDVPLRRVTDVALDRSLGQRLVGSGTVTLTTAGEDEPVRLVAVPQSDRLYRTLLRLVSAAAPPAEREDGDDG